MISNFSADAGEVVRKLYPSASAAVFAWMSNRGEVSLAGFRIRADRAETVFLGEPWPSTPADASLKARQVLDRVLARK